jgi:[acyl-carrier-protein] S-malonyltransferase
MAMKKRIGLMFAGQGAQQPGMGLDLHENYAEVKSLFSQADRVSGRLLSDLCFRSSMEELTACANCQPAIFTMSIACYRALQTEYPFAPVACAGLSLGEYAALHAAGVYDFAAALQLVSARGCLMDLACRQQAGGMAAVLGLEQAQVDELCRRHGIEVANYNSPEQMIISGASDRVDDAVAELTAVGQKAIRLQVAGAFHSSLMAPAVDAFARELDKYPLSPPNFLVAQNFSGSLVSEPAELKRNLLCQISGSVRWEACFNLLKERCDVLLELGPGTVLAGLARRMDRAFPVFSVNSVATLAKAIDALKTL